MIAAKRGYIEAVNTLLEFNSRLDLKDKQGKNVLFYAIEGGRNYDIVESLLNKNESKVNIVNIESETG